MIDGNIDLQPKHRCRTVLDTEYKKCPLKCYTLSQMLVRITSNNSVSQQYIVGERLHTVAQWKQQAVRVAKQYAPAPLFPPWASRRNVAVLSHAE